MIAIFGIVGLSFAAAQGGMIFLTAWLFRKRLRLLSWWSKPLLMAASYLLWIAITIIGYFIVGGEGGLMDGFGLILILCFSAFMAALAYSVLWLSLPLFTSQRG